MCIRDRVPSYYIFMVGCAVALFVNYPGAKMQGKIIKSHAGPALTMASTILCAGVFLGVMQQTEIMTQMANERCIRDRLKAVTVPSWMLSVRSSRLNLMIKFGSENLQVIGNWI